MKKKNIAPGINPSKMKDPRFWIRWYQQGQVAQKVYPEGSLVIDAMGVSSAGMTTLTLGRVPHGRGSKPLTSVVVPSSGAYRLGKVLSEIPKHAVPAKLFHSHRR